jgi:hypothetical protein
MSMTVYSGAVGWSCLANETALSLNGFDTDDVMGLSRGIVNQLKPPWYTGSRLLRVLGLFSYMPIEQFSGHSRLINTSI